VVLDEIESHAVKIVWSLPVRGESLNGSRGDLVRARHLVEALRSDAHEVTVVEEAARPGARITVSVFRLIVRRMLPRYPVLVLRDLGRLWHGHLHGSRVAAMARRREAQMIIETQVPFAPSGFIAANRTTLPLILDDCSPSSEESVLGSGSGLPGLARRVLQRQARMAARVVVVSRAVRRLLVSEGIPREKLHVVPNGIDAATAGASNRRASRRHLGLDDSCVIGFVGSFQPWHRVDLLVQAFEKLLRRYPVRLLLVGEGPGLAPTLALSGRLGLSDYVTSLGSVPSTRVPELIAAIDIGALPGTNHYGNPMKLMEYAAGGISSVAPDVEPVREALELGAACLLFPSGDLSGLTRVLATLAGNTSLRCSMGERAHRQVVSRCTWKIRARGLVDGLTTLVEDGANGFPPQEARPRAGIRPMGVKC
jgi:glycosyltransferase involved in cell wall biosynthesis